MAVEHRLVIQHGDRKTVHVLQTQTTVLGRDSSCDLFFVDRKLSRRHARLEVSESDVDLIDLGSRNGCWVNGARISRQRLHPGDILRIGSLRMHFYTETRPDEEVAPAGALTPALEPTIAVTSPSRPATLPLNWESLIGDETVNAEPPDDPATDPDAPKPATPAASHGGAPTVAAPGKAFPPAGESPVTETHSRERTLTAPPFGRRPALPTNPRPALGARAGALMLLAGGLVYLVPGLYALFQGTLTTGTVAHEAERALVVLVETNRPFIEAGATTDLDLSLIERVPSLEAGWILGPDAAILHQHGRLSLSEVLSGSQREVSDGTFSAGLYLLQTPILGSEGQSLGSLLLAYDGASPAQPRPFPAVAFAAVGLFGLLGALLLYRSLSPWSAMFSNVSVPRAPRETRI